MSSTSRSTPLTAVALAIDQYAVPAFITDRFNCVRFANREFARLVGDPVRDGLAIEDRFIASLMVGAYRERFPRREEELAACLPRIPMEVERGNLAAEVLGLMRHALVDEPRLQRRVSDGEPSWDGTVLIRGRDGSEQCVREVVIPLSSGGYHLNQWIPEQERIAAEPVPAVLTPRQLEIARLFGSGMTSREVAERAGISQRTARDHLEEIYARLDVHSRAALAALLVREAVL